MVRKPIAVSIVCACLALTTPFAFAEESAPIQVTSIDLAGSPAVATELKKVVAAAIGKRLSATELEALAQRLTNYCAERGYKRIRVILPPQEFEGGAVHLQIIETPYRDPVAVLLEQARLWEGLGRGDLASQSLEKLFRIAPDHPDALAAMARRQLAANDREGALKTLAHLRKIKPDHPQIRRLSEVVRALGADRGKLQQARLLARSGRKHEAVAAYRKLFPSGAPDGDLGMEYWQVVADSGDWPHARAGMARIVRENPGNRRYRLSLAELEASRDPVSSKTLLVFAQLADDPDYGREARAAWRSAIVRQPQGYESAAQWHAYLQHDPNDSAVRDRLAQWKGAKAEEERKLNDPTLQAKLAGLRLLEEEKNDAAEEQFSIALAGRPDDADALGGIGIIRLRQGRHAEARPYFQQALDRDAENAQKWRSLLNTASFWALMRESAQAREAGDLPLAESKVREALAIDPQEINAVVKLADLLVERKRDLEAEQRYREALTIQPDHAGAYEGLLALYLRNGKETEARSLIASAPAAQQASLSREYERAHSRKRRQSADELIAAGQIDEAIIALQQSLAAGRQAQGDKLSALRESTAQEPSGSLLAVDWGAPVASDYRYQYKKLARLLDERTDWINGAFDWHSRSGTPGESQLDLKEIPVEWRHPWRSNEQIFLRADAVDVDAGAVAANQRDFGTQLLCVSNCNGATANQHASGVSLAAGYVGSGIRADIGTTPLGFPVTNIVGGIGTKADLGPFGVSVELSRRPMTGSLLSFAGTHDTGTGRVWGGVVATGIRLGLSADEGGAFGFWSSLGVHRLTGKNVLDNDRLQLMAGGYWRAINEEDRLLSIGLTGMAWHLNKDAGEYTFGHGGYYSPQQYYSLSLPVTWAQRFTRFSYALRASVSTSWSKTDAAPYFPTDSALQTQSGAFFSASAGAGTGYALSAAAEYQWKPPLFVGGRLELERSDYYAPNRVLLYIRYALGHAAAQPVPLNPDPVIPYSQF